MGKALTPTKISASEPHIGGYRLTMEDMQFVDNIPGGTATKTAAELSGELKNIERSLKEHRAKCGPDCPHWGKVATGVRSPERYFPLRDREIELKVRANGVAASSRDASQQVQVHDIFARHVPGYKWVPRKTAKIVNATHADQPGTAATAPRPVPAPAPPRTPAPASR